jgi:hypothetical protein
MKHIHPAVKDAQNISGDFSSIVPLKTCRRSRDGMSRSLAAFVTPLFG